MKLDVLFQKIASQDKSDAPLLFYRAVGRVVAEKNFYGQNDRPMKLLTVKTEWVGTFPHNNDRVDQNDLTEKQYFICQRRALGKYRQKKFRGLEVVITRFALCWTFRSKQYCITSRGTKIKKIGSSKRRKSCRIIAS